MLFSFTFFTITMFVSGKVGIAFDLGTLIWTAIIDNGLMIVEVLVLQGLTMAAMVIYPARLCGWQ